MGITSQTNPKKRWQYGNGYRGQEKFYSAIKKYGWNNFEHKVLFSHLSKEQAEKLEVFFIKTYNSISNGYNVELGGSTHCHSEITKRKIAEANKKRVITKEMHKNFSKGQMGNNNKGKPVRCIETGIIYKSSAEAARQIGLSGHSAIAGCYNKRKGYKTAGGFHWEFV